MTATKIEWTDFSWNPIRAMFLEKDDPSDEIAFVKKLGWFCVHVSPGCINCYSETMNRRLGTGIDYKAQNARQVEMFLDEKMLLAALKWKKPRKVFVCSMTDLFADFVTDEIIDRVFAVMALCPHLTFQVLTKRPERMQAYISECQGNVWDARTTLPRSNRVTLNRNGDPITTGMPAWPLPNVWLGTSVEDQQRADERIPHLLATPAAVRFLSVEPLLGPIDLTDRCDGWRFYDALRGEQWHDDPDGPNPRFPMQSKIDWVICGGESGPNARPMHPDWARSLRDQCAEAGVAFHFKQWGEWGPVYDRAKDDPDWRRCEQVAQRTPRGQWLNLAGGQGFHGECVVRVDRIGKKRAGRLLDGAEHNQFPEPRT